MIRSFFPGLSGNPVAAFIATAVVGVVLLALPLVAGAVLGNFWVRMMAMALLYVMLAFGLNIVVGFAGLLDLGYVAFYAVGAYMYALLASPHLAEQFEWIARMFPDGLHADIWLIVPLGVAIAAFFGVLLGAPGPKLRGDFLALATRGSGQTSRTFPQQ